MNTPSPATLFEIAVAGSEGHTEDECRRLARWFFREHSLADLEAAARYAFDPPGRRPSVPALVVLMVARRMAREAMPTSPEVAYFDPRTSTEEIDGHLYLQVESAFDDVTDP